MIMEVCILVIDEPEGILVSTHASEDEARAELVDYAKEYWDEEKLESPIPDDPDEIVAMFYANNGGYEGDGEVWYTIELHTIECHASPFSDASETSATRMKNIIHILSALRLASGPLVKGEVGSGHAANRYPENTTAEKIKSDLYWLLLDLSVDLGIRDDIDRDELAREITEHW